MGRGDCGDDGARLLELDGTKWAPIDHGPCAAGGVLAAAARVARARFAALEPDSIEFALMALVCAPPE